MIAVGGFLTFDQFQNDRETLVKANRSEDKMINQESVIDTLRFLTDPAYEYTEICSGQENNTRETLSKTVLSVNQKRKANHNRTEVGLKKYPANASVNMMLKTYSVSREQDSCNTSYFVTVESFDLFLETESESDETGDYSTCKYLSPEELIESIRSGQGLKMVQNTCREIKPI